jgi:arylformamidase
MKLYGDFSSQAEIDAQYNASLRVADPAAEMAHYAAAAGLARQRLQCRLDLRYGATLDETLDIFPAAQPSARQ